MVIGEGVLAANYWRTW